MGRKFRLILGFIAVQSCLVSSCFAAEKGVVVVKPVNETTVEQTKQYIKDQPHLLRQMEYLDRGLLAVQLDKTVYLSWRWLGTESSHVTYNIYRNGIKVNSEPVELTNYVDITPVENATYQVAAIVNGKEQEKCESVKVMSDNALTINLDKPVGGEINGEAYTYTANDASVADLDGDGEYEIILKWDPSNSKDAATSGYTGPVYIDAYKMDGTKLWRVNLGPNIRAGAHDTQFIAYDFDGDGKAEVAFRTADGTIDAQGNVIGEKEINYAQLNEGKNLQGPLYLSVFKGDTGTVIDTVPYDPQSTDEGGIEAYGDNWGNRSERYLASVGYLDGEHPSMIFARGYYTSKEDAKVGRTVIAAYALKAGKLQKTWRFDTNDYDNDYIGQGNHWMSTADVDFDGKDEIIYGSLVVDDNGKPLYSTGLGHGDAQHTGDLIPGRPGLETFSVHESTTVEYSMDMRDARTGEMIFASYEAKDVGRGMSADIDPRYEGAESWANGKMINSKGEVIATNPIISTNFRIYWDGDLGEELQDSIHISKWNGEINRAETIFSAKGVTSINGTKANSALTADIFGDWREEVIYPNTDSSALKIFTTTTPTNYRMYTLMHNSQYRTDIATQNVAYNQPAHTSFYLGYDTKSIPVPSIKTNAKGEEQKNPDLSQGNWTISDLYHGNFVFLSTQSSNAIVDQILYRIDNEDDTQSVKPFIDQKKNVYVPKDFLEKHFEVEFVYDEAQAQVMTTNGKIYAIVKKEDKVYVPINLILLEQGYEVKVDKKEGSIIISDQKIRLTNKQMTSILANLNVSKSPTKHVPQPIVTTNKLYDKQLDVYYVKASGDDGNVAVGAVDGDMNTRWSASGPNWITLDLGSVQKVSGVAIAMWKGNERIYPFSIEVSTNGEEWKTVLSKTKNSMTTDQAEEYKFEEIVEARYVRYSGDGDTIPGKNYCHISEMVVLP